MPEGADRFTLVSFATELYVPYRERLVQSARGFEVGIDAAFLWDEHRLRETGFYTQNQEILDLKRGAGYWLWKPYVILQALKSSAPDALVLYVDSQIQIVGDLEPLTRILREGEDIMVFQDGRLLLNKCWTKRDAFVLMDCDTPPYWFAPQLQAGVLAFRNTERSRAFVREWLELCQDARILTDQPNEAGQPNWIDFIDHRHDQSVLTNLAVKQGVRPYRELSQHGREFTIGLDYRDVAGTVHRLEYPTAPSPYGVLTEPDPTRPVPPSPPLPPPPSLARRWLRRLRHAYGALKG